MKHSKGFTMIELIVTLAVLAILVAIAIPTYNGLMPRYRLNGAARQVATDLMKARMQAVKLSTNVTVTFTTTGYTISGGSYSETFNIQSQYPGVSIPTTGGPQFHPRGTAASTFTVTLTNSSGSKDIEVNIAGRVK
jgi:prepilin-type N-terminal cleavage/methylation domain